MLCQRRIFYNWVLYPFSKLKQRQVHAPSADSDLVAIPWLLQTYGIPTLQQRTVEHLATTTHLLHHLKICHLQFSVRSLNLFRESRPCWLLQPHPNLEICCLLDVSMAVAVHRSPFCHGSPIRIPKCPSLNTEMGSRSVHDTRSAQGNVHPPVCFLICYLPSLYSWGHECLSSPVSSSQ